MPIEIPAGVSDWERLAAVYHAGIGAKLLVSSDARGRSVSLPAGVFTVEEFKLAVLGLAEASGLELVTISDTLHLVRFKRHDAGILPQVTDTAVTPSSSKTDLSAVTNVSTGTVAAEKLPGRVIQIEAAIGTVSLGHQYESGVDFLAALDAFEMSTAGAAGISIPVRGAAVRSLQLGSSPRPVSTFFKLLDSDTDYSSIARPRLHIAEGQTGSIATGQRVAVPSQTLTTSQGGGAATSATIQFQDVQLRLQIMPRVLDDGRLLLQIEQTDDSISGSQQIAGNTVPTIASQTFATSTIVRHGETIAVGGIIMRRTQTGAKGPRGLARVPLLGRLFRVESQTHSESELLILLTAWLLE